MPVLEAEEVTEPGFAPESRDFKLSEAITLSERDAEEAAALVEAYVDDESRSERLAESVRQGDALVLDLIRPCVGRGRGKHFYKAGMLEANAKRFNGWKMYLNHLSEAARRALGGLPRDVRDLGGIVQETWWNPDVPAEGRFGKGAVQGVVSPVPVIRELHKVDPRLVECSINATATGVKPGKVGGERVLIVEGIEDKGSVDWVTEAGAGGRVAQIMEALIEDGSEVSDYLDMLDSGTLVAWIEEHRPDLAEAMKKKGATVGGTDPDGPDAEDELDAQVEKLLKANPKMGRGQAMALAKKAVAKKKVNEGGEGVPEITPEAIEEALTSDAGKAAIAEAVTDAVKGLNLGTEIVTLVEARMEGDREIIRREAEARADRRNELRDMRDDAHRKIDESKLHDRLKTQVKSRFDLVEGEPTDALDLVDDTDETGKVVKTARAKLDEALTDAIRESLELQAALSPTRIRGQGALVEGEVEKDEEGNPKPPDKVGVTTRSLLESAGIKDPAAAYEHGRRVQEAGLTSVA